MHYCLGLEVWRDSSQTFLSQGKYVKSLVTKFKMDECKVAFMPLKHNNNTYLGQVLMISQENSTRIVTKPIYKLIMSILQ